MELSKLKNEKSKPNEIMNGKVYRHYKGKLYKVIAMGRDSEDPSIKLVIYQGLYNCPTFGQNPIWCRTYSMFIENVFIDGKEQPRFKEIDDNKLESKNISFNYTQTFKL